jgi:hypothetical protein
MTREYMTRMTRCIVFSGLNRSKGGDPLLLDCRLIFAITDPSCFSKEGRWRCSPRSFYDKAMPYGPRGIELISAPVNAEWTACKDYFTGLRALAEKARL